MSIRLPPRVVRHSPPKPPPPTRAELLGAIGSDDFYELVARAEPRNATKWRRMAQVQKRFKDAEPGYRNPAARTYSESNRETLHRVTIALLDRRATHKLDVYRAFVALHPALFRENGAYLLPERDQAAILVHTDPRMLFLRPNPHLLARGLHEEERWRPLVQQAANETRAARAAQGLPVTRSGFKSR